MLYAQHYEMIVLCNEMDLWMKRKGLKGMNEKKSK